MSGENGASLLHTVAMTACISGVVVLSEMRWGRKEETRGAKSLRAGGAAIAACLGMLYFKRKECYA